jgi:hypothetical protein
VFIDTIAEKEQELEKLKSKVARQKKVIREQERLMDLYRKNIDRLNTLSLERYRRIEALIVENGEHYRRIQELEMQVWDL